MPPESFALVPFPLQSIDLLRRAALTRPLRPSQSLAALLFGAVCVISGRPVPVSARECVLSRHCYNMHRISCISHEVAHNIHYTSLVGLNPTREVFLPIQPCLRHSTCNAADAAVLCVALRRITICCVLCVCGASQFAVFCAYVCAWAILRLCGPVRLRMRVRVACAVCDNRQQMRARLGYADASDAEWLEYKSALCFDGR